MDSTCRRTLPSLLLAFVLPVLLLLPTLPARAQDADEDGTLDPANPVTARRLEAALAGLEERVRLLDRMTADAVRAYRRAAIARNDALQELVQARDGLDREATRVRDLTLDRLEELLKETGEAEARYRGLEEEAARRLADLRRLVAEREALVERIADLRARMPQREEVLTGEWEVTWMPAGVTGTFYLEQSGTLVTGQYRLGPLGSGSLQGTFVGGKLHLQRIDAERGRDAELSGVLDPDGKRIRGTWQSFELVQGGIPRGQWVARRVR